MDDPYLEIFIRCDSTTKTVLSFVSKVFLGIFVGQNEQRLPKATFLTTVTGKLLEWGVSMGCPSTYKIDRDLVQQGRLDILSNMKDVDTYSVLQLAAEYNNAEIFRHYFLYPLPRREYIVEKVRSLEIIQLVCDHWNLKCMKSIRTLIVHESFDALLFLYEQGIITIHNFSKEDIVVASKDLELFKRLTVDYSPGIFSNVWRLDALKVLDNKVTSRNLEAAALAGSYESFEWLRGQGIIYKLGTTIAMSPSLEIVKKYGKISYEFFKEAVRSGTKEVVKYLLKEEYNDYCYVIKRCSSLEVMKMMYKRGFVIHSDLLSNCIQEGRHDCVEWLLEVLDKNSINLSMLETSRVPVTLLVAKLIHKHGFNLTSTLSNFVREGDIEGVEWCRELGLTSLDRYKMHEAITRDKYEFVEWLVSSGWEISREMVKITIEHSLLRIYRLFYEKAYYSVEEVVPKNPLMIQFLWNRNRELALRGYEELTAEEKKWVKKHLF